MSYLTRQEIPNYWAYADAFVLQDRMFAPTDGWTLPAHLFLVSGWSAYCYDPNDPMSCISDVDLKEEHERFEYGEDPIYAWTDITWLLDREGVSWGYYVAPGTCSFPPCHGQAIDGAEGSTTATRNPLPGFTDLHETGQQDHILDYGNFERAAARGTLPSVSWIVPGDGVSEHPQSSRGVAAGMAHVTRLVNAVMRGPDWDSSAIFITWDDWGGFYDHVNPPLADENGYGLRVPGLLVSPYARRGLHRSPDAHVRCLPEADRGPVPGRSAPGSGDRREAGLAPPRARNALDPGRPGPGVRLRPAAAAADDPRPDRGESHPPRRQVGHPARPSTPPTGDLGLGRSHPEKGPGGPCTTRSRDGRRLKHECLASDIEGRPARRVPVGVRGGRRDRPVLPGSGRRRRTASEHRADPHGRPARGHAPVHADRATDAGQARRDVHERLRLEPRLLSEPRHDPDGPVLALDRRVHERRAGRRVRRVR